MDSNDKQERKQRRIDKYLNARNFYSAKERREAVKFEREKTIKKRAYAIAKLSKELKQCQEIYLNCFYQIGGAHRLASLIENLEHLSISNDKSNNLQGNKLITNIIDKTVDRIVDYNTGSIIKVVT